MALELMVLLLVVCFHGFLDYALKHLFLGGIFG